MKKIPDIKVNEIAPETKNNLRGRIITAIFLGLVAIPCLVIGDILFFVFIFVASLLACHEIVKTPTKLSEERHKKIIYVFSYVMLFVLIYWFFIKYNIKDSIDAKKIVIDIYNGFKVPSITLSGFALCCGFFFLMVVIDKNFKITDAFFFISMLFVVAIGFQSILFLRFEPFYDAGITRNESSNLFKYLQSFELIGFVLLGTLMNDAGAYFTGILFGKHKMTEISPKKTWEGFVGGIIFSIIFSLGYASIFTACGLPMLSFLDWGHWYNILILSIFIPFVGTLGDLIFSAVKRHYGIKDFGTILKSMGGILDRIDSIIFSATASSLLILLMSHHWGILL